MNTNFLPETDGDLANWLSHFANRLEQYQQILGLPQNTVNSVAADATAFSYTVQLQDATRQCWIAISNMKKALRRSPVQRMSAVLPAPVDLGPPPPMVPDGIFDRIILLAAQIRLKTGYTIAIGQDLGIVPPPFVPVNPADMMPELTVIPEAGFPFLKWKKGDSDGAMVYVDRRDGNGMVQLARTVKNNFLDTSPLPANTHSATWDYSVRYMLGDTEVGQPSATISVNVLRA